VRTKRDAARAERDEDPLAERFLDEPELPIRGAIWALVLRRR
jgi:hypothetical protein